MLLVLGSRNSSNSLRLVEIGAECGIPGHLLDGPAELGDAWFRDGAGDVRRDRPHHRRGQRPGAGREGRGRRADGTGTAPTVSEETLRTESVRFPLPKELRPETPAKTVVTLGA